MQNAASSAMLVAGWHRMSYAFNNQSLMSQVLENQIRKLHHCCWKCSHTRKVHRLWYWLNPTPQCCSLNKAVLHGPYVKAIHDHAYYWPHFTGIPAPADEDVMVFTLSKLTGHAGTRFGWALIKDEAVYQRMSTYVKLNCLGISRDAQLRAYKLLKVVMEGSGREIFEFGHATMKNRWEKLSSALSVSKRFSIQDIAPQYCTFFQTVRAASPAYAWLRCEREEDKDCYRALKKAGIIGREGTLFGTASSYVRLSLIKTQDDFDLLLHQIKS
ncbi:Tryptophan aminotransferase-related protein 3 [Vitis vinifera]|uniref:Tryptophan aminotransferase-related protein 3 n=1 Tax=Vitis vinifera TaxID=29760 RepID=A0A438DPI0_VITVI|nr:Tryptophan aminotransferase-related protein 3 [Vitis vinifera]